MAQSLLARHRFLDPLQDLLGNDVRDWFVGVDRMIDDMSRKWEDALAGFNGDVRSSIDRVDDTHYRVTMTVPGYAKEDLTVKVVDEDELVISGARESAEKAEERTAERSAQFEQRYLLAEHMHVDGAAFADGKLTIDVSFPEPPKAKETLVTIA